MPTLCIEGRWVESDNLTVCLQVAGTHEPSLLPMGKLVHDYVLDAKTGWVFEKHMCIWPPRGTHWMGTATDYVSSLPCHWMWSYDWILTNRMWADWRALLLYHLPDCPSFLLFHGWEHQQLQAWRWRWWKTTWKEPGSWNNLMEQSHPTSLDCSLQMVRAVRNRLLLYGSFCGLGFRWHSK